MVKGFFEELAPDTEPSDFAARSAAINSSREWFVTLPFWLLADFGVVAAVSISIAMGYMIEAIAVETTK